jgi:predicted tellurium resistance membrane protein TerC
MTAKGKAYLGTILISVVLILVGVGFISEGPKHIPAFAAYAVLILLVILSIINLVSKRSVRSRTRTKRKV